jgi:hypothetical protein
MQGMLAPERLNILQKTFDQAKRSGLHNIHPPATSFSVKVR